MHNNKIFISIACWRDPLVRKTIQSAISMAKNPDNISFGVIFQGYDKDAWMVDGLDSITKNIKILKFDAADKNCPLNICYIRGELCQSLLEDENFYLQIDSHVKFGKNWDSGLIQELHAANDKFGKSILTGPTRSFRDWDIQEGTGGAETALPDKVIFEEWKNFTVGKPKLKLDKVQMVEYFMNAGFRFSDVEYVNDITQPKNILWDYEQPLMALKTFVAGYEMISPSSNYIFTYDFYNLDCYPEVNVEDIRFMRRFDPNWEEIMKDEFLVQADIFNEIISSPTLDFKDTSKIKRTLQDFISMSGFDIYTLDIFQNYTDEYLYQDRRVNIIEN